MNCVLVTALILLLISALTSCSSTASSARTDAGGNGIPNGFIGEWKCEETASDGKTDTDFYEMYIRADGSFSLYDAAAGNPGISGTMKSHTDSTVNCRFNTEDFDPPFCWTIDPPEAAFGYEIGGDTLKLCHNNVWMIFHRMKEEEPPPVPQPLDDLIAFSLPAEFVPDEEFCYDGAEEEIIVERSYTSEQKGYFSVSILSYCGFDCFGDVKQAVDLEEYVSATDNMRQIAIDGETGYFGTHESDDMPDMVAVVYLPHGDYVFEFRLTNFDEQVTKEQLAEFEQIVTCVTFKY